MVAGCGTVILNESGSLTRYDRLNGSTEVATGAKLYADQPTLAATRTVRIIPAAFPESISGPGLNSVERRLIANAADRALCYELSLRYDVVSTKKADLTIRSAVTRVELTNVPAAGATIATSAGITVASQLGVGFATAVGRVPIPRIPIGLGSITIEAEALDSRHQQRAAMIWGGGANAFTNQARFSAAGDAYDLAGEFGQDFGTLLVTAVDPELESYPHHHPRRGSARSGLRAVRPRARHRRYGRRLYRPAAGMDRQGPPRPDQLSFPLRCRDPAFAQGPAP
jgi:hypothetical protein